MASSTGFWSYVHGDDSAEGGRISRLSRDVTAQYQLITGEDLQIFMDKEDLNWGDQWRFRINEAIVAGTFFIPVISPRYFQSTECRRELTHFAQTAKALGVVELIMPILYADFPALNADPCPDDLIALAKSFQWEDWRELRFAAVDSPEYRRAVAGLANRLSMAAASAEKVDVGSTTEQLIGNEDSDDSPGFVDKIARSETALPEWNETVIVITAEIERVGELMQDAATEIANRDARGGGFAGRLDVARTLTEKLEEPAAKLQELANQFTAQLNEVDLGVRAIIDLIPNEAESQPRNIPQIMKFLSSIKYLIKQGKQGLGSLEGMMSSIQANEGTTRSLRPVLRKLRNALTILYEGRLVLDEWEALIVDLDFPSDEEAVEEFEAIENV
ncbi:MAG: hypothetical protein V7643_4058 [Mycobacterium sp.]|jgi:hypothetical protein